MVLMTDEMLKATEEVAIDYELADENNVRADAEKALRFILDGQVGDCLVILPQALNPLLRSLEALSGIWKNIVIVPYTGQSVKPAYLIMKVAGEVISVITADRG